MASYRLCGQDERTGCQGKAMKLRGMLLLLNWICDVALNGNANYELSKSSASLFNMCFDVGVVVFLLLTNKTAVYNYY